MPSSVSNSSEQLERRYEGTLEIWVSQQHLRGHRLSSTRRRTTCVSVRLECGGRPLGNRGRSPSPEFRSVIRRGRSWPIALPHPLDHHPSPTPSDMTEPQLRRYVVQRLGAHGRGSRCSWRHPSSDVISDMRVNVMEEGNDKVVWYKVGVQITQPSMRPTLPLGTVPVGRRDLLPK